MEKVSMSHEAYLEAIVMLGGTTENPVRSVDIANKLGVSKASVNKAMNALKEKGFADQPYYGDVTLTEDGYRYGARAPRASAQVPHQGFGHSRGHGRRGSVPDGACHQRRVLQEMEFLYQAA